MNFFPNKNFIFTAALILLNIALIAKVLAVTEFFASRKSQADFDVYYQTVSDIRLGQNPYSVPYMRNPAPPLVFLYFIPFTAFPLVLAQNLNLIINLVSGYLTCLLLSRRHWLVLSLMLFGSFPGRYSLQIGQPMLLLGLLITLFVITRNSIVVAFSIALKTHLLFSLLSLRRIPRFLLVVVLVSLVVLSPRWHSYYFTHPPDLGLFSPAQAHLDTEYYNQSIRANMSRLLPGPAYPLVYLAALATGIYLSLKTSDPALGILFSFLLSPVSWQHYFAALFPLYILALKKARTHAALLLTIAALTLWFPDLQLHEVVPTLANRILASHFFFSLILLTIAQTVNLRYNSPHGLLVQR